MKQTNITQQNIMSHDGCSKNDVFTWWDIVKIQGVCYAEQYKISGKTDGSGHYQIDDFLCAVAHKHGVDMEDIETYMLDGIEFEPNKLPWGAESCGCYINGVAQWLLDHEYCGGANPW
jgi:hypothetical protein